MKKNLLKIIVVLIVLVAGLNVKWMVNPVADTHYSLAQSLSIDIEEKHFSTSIYIKDNINYYINHEFSVACDIVKNYDNVVVVEYKGNDYKVFVKDGDNYNNATKANVTFKAAKNLKDYQVIDIWIDK